jgi:hypothetical protein
MAGDWIKVQKDTPDKPEVLAIAARMNLDPDAVVGKLVRIWSWFDTHTIDGNAQSVTYSFLDRLTGVTGFAEQVSLVGWLEQNGHELTLPNFGYHNGETAKTRALGKKRTEKHRSNAESNAESNGDSVTKTSPEKRIEEKRRNKEDSATEVALLPDWIPLEAWAAFLEMRRKIKKPPTEHAINLLIAKLDRFRQQGQDIQAILEKSITSGWQDVFELKENKSFAQQAADIVRTTVPASKDPDPALLKIAQDAKRAVPIPTHIRDQINALTRKI